MTPRECWEVWAVEHARYAVIRLCHWDRSVSWAEVIRKWEANLVWFGIKDDAVDM